MRYLVAAALAVVAAGLAFELRSFSASAGHVEPGQPLPPPPGGILEGLPCQPPAFSGAPLPGHL